ncbi:MAG: hypothetical protein AB1486_01960 [Planctomycetota bacterium]
MRLIGAAWRGTSARWAAAWLLAGCSSADLFESGVPGSSGAVEENALALEPSLEFLTGTSEREGEYDLVATFPPASFEAFTIETVRIDGEPASYFSVHNDGVWTRLRHANGRDPLIIHAYGGWQPRRQVVVEVAGRTPAGAPVLLRVAGQAPDERRTAAALQFLMPDGDAPAYRVKTTVPAADVRDGRIDRILANGTECRDVTVVQQGRESYDRRVKAGAAVDVTARFDWRAGQEVRLEVGWEGSDALWSVAGAAAAGGWWNEDWRYYAGVSVEETSGVGRLDEPLHVTLGILADRLSEPTREVRVVTYDPADPRADERGFREVPSQVSSVDTWRDEELLAREEIDAKSGAKILRYSATTTLDVAFLADVPSYRKRAYLVFYGNPSASAPSYATDLVVRGEGLGLTVENEFYRISHAANSGAVETVWVKQGLDILLEHKLETNGAVQWNPDVYMPPHAWVHASDWEAPQQEVVVGPVFCMLRRWAPLPHTESVLASSTNVYYAHQPYFLVSESTRVTQPLHVQALRQAEVVFNHAVLDEFAWRDEMGAVRSFPISGSRPHPGHAVELPIDTSWLAFCNRECKVAFAGITLEAVASNLTGGLPRLSDSYFYVANGPWIYWSRSLVYPFGSNNASRMVHVPAEAVYLAKTAYVPARLADGREPFEPIEMLRRKLSAPLQATVQLDTDPRTPKGWVVPILVEPFDEGVEGALGESRSKEEGDGSGEEKR